MKTCPLLVAALVTISVASSLGRAEAACTATPRAGCKVPFVPHQSTLTFLQTAGNDPDDIFTWRWLSGSQTTVADFGDPLTTDYDFCIYDQSARAQPVIDDIAASAQAWGTMRNGFLYRALHPHALRSLRLHAGVDGKANVRAHGNSDTVETLLPFTPPVTVQFQANGGECWETDFVSPVRNNARAFMAKD